VKSAPGKSQTTVPPFGEERHLDFTLRHYQTCKHYDMPSVCSGHGDAAHMCDAIAADILREHTVNGRVTKQGEALAAAVKRAGDAIWRMREKLQ